MRLYRLMRHGAALRPTLLEAPTLEPGEGEVRVAVEAASLNFRDLIVLDAAAQSDKDGRVPLSDAAGRVDAVGPGVTRWRIGDRVAAAFFRHWIGGRFKAEFLPSALGGGTTDGVLAESIIAPQAALVAVPEHLSSLEAATLPCAAVTAFHALVLRAQMRAGDTVLIQGTGGVALFGLQFAVSMGARALVLSSSNEKLARAGALGAAVLINYSTTPRWDQAVLEFTDGAGADHILELGGPATYERSLRAVAAGGNIAQIGVLTGRGPQPNLARLQGMNANILGITVGSVEHFEAMNAWIARARIAPVIDGVFEFEDAGSAYDHLRSAQHFGKVVVRM
jgi:NADPH:quinone reductase-like Zn-dependent oxidoreductase